MIKDVCPRCKGKKYIRGQEINKYKNLPNYNHVEKGICFICDGEGKAYTDGDSFFKIKNDRTVLEYDDKGQYQGISLKYGVEDIIDEYPISYEERSYKAKDLIEVEKGYRQVAIDLTKKSLSECFDNLIPLYNDEECILELANWNIDKSIIKSILKENKKTKEYMSDILKVHGSSMKEENFEKLLLIFGYAATRYDRIIKHL